MNTAPITQQRTFPTPEQIKIHRRTTKKQKQGFNQGAWLKTKVTYFRHWGPLSAARKNRIEYYEKDKILNTVYKYGTQQVNNGFLKMAPYLLYKASLYKK